MYPILSRPSTKLILGTLQSYDGDSNGDFKKTVGLMSKTSTLHNHHAFLDIFFSSLPNYDVKWPNFKATWERERKAINWTIFAVWAHARSPLVSSNLNSLL